MRLAGNLHRHKISEEFEFRPDRTIDFEVTCYIVPKSAIFDLVWSIVFFAWIFMKVADNLDRQKISEEFEFRQNRTI